jgi:hypothetical protein
MGERKMGGHRGTEERRQVSTLRRKTTKGSKRKYPKCVPLAKATRMSASQKASAVRRKRAAGNTGPKPKMVKTFVSKKKAEEIKKDVIQLV